MTSGQCSCSLSPNGVFPSSSESNSIKEISSLASENTQKSSSIIINPDSTGSDICENDAIFSHDISAVDKSSFSDPLGDLTQVSGAVDFFETSEEKDPCHFLYYGWPEIGSLDDVDRILGDCDTLFELEATKEKLNWLSTSEDLAESEDMLQLDFKFPPPQSHVVEDMSENLDESKNFSINDIVMTSTPIMFNGSSCSPEKSDTFVSFDILNESAKIDNQYALLSKEQVDHIKQSKYQQWSEGKRKKSCFEDYDSNRVNELPIEVEQCCGTIPHSVVPSLNDKQKYGAFRPDSRNYLQNTVALAHQNNCLLSYESYVDPAQSSTKPKTSNLRKPLPRESSHDSIQLQASIFDPVSGGKIHFSGSKFENQIDADAMSPVTSSELGTPNGHENSTISSHSDDISLEAASFLQLQHVMEQLDLKTKLCLRDSLYRLAQSAEQRHNHANPKGICEEERDACEVLTTDRAIRHPGFLITETGTNPIDRSIAHLLFHRPSDANALPPNDHSPFKSPRLERNPLTNPPKMVHNLVVPEDFSPKAEKQDSDRRQKCGEMQNK